MSAARCMDDIIKKLRLIKNDSITFSEKGKEWQKAARGVSFFISVAWSNISLICGDHSAAAKRHQPCAESFWTCISAPVGALASVNEPANL
jgi:hypothetical protein